MPEISEQDFAALAAQVASLSSALAVARRRIDDLEEGMTDHLGLDWGESLVDVNSPHPNISANTVESGGGTIRQDENGMQVATGGVDSAALFFVTELSPDPSSEEHIAQIVGNTEASGLEYSHVRVEARDNGTDRYVRMNAVQLRDGGYTMQWAISASKVGYLTFSLETGYDFYMQLSGAYPAFSSVLTPPQITATTNDYSPTGLTEAAVLRVSTDASRDLTGIAAPFVSGRVLWVFNVGSFDIVVKNENASSTAANRFALNGDVTVQPGNGAPLWYDGDSDRWRMF